MSSLMIRDLSSTRELDRRAMFAVSGGTGSSVPGLPSVSGLSGIANVNVNVNVNQELNQAQFVSVSALNGNGFIGANILPPLQLDVSPVLKGGNFAAV
ncbi:hypothetical protein FVF58_17935 [Paraburkholderia panacisoli]|uniref:Uncharacterized protein n=1 Tax=Paraburkholderia panacisoli TaxID=2603818 RepID=A0A5B0H683_9BURK|nr:hypothetical protein [Paraburkholderia panacisoli]KAA1010747.1 hypothetical protein FVF58_17935 [Paraburkholderia panacisoli]